MGKYIITLYDKNWDIIRETLVKVENLGAANKMANKMIPRKVNDEICGAGARTLRDYGLVRFYERQKESKK